MNDYDARIQSTAMRWSAVEVGCRVSFQIVITISMTRLLSPHEFGLIAFLGFFLAVADTLMQSGFVLAFIQKKSADEIFAFGDAVF